MANTDKSGKSKKRLLEKALIDEMPQLMFGARATYRSPVLLVAQFSGSQK